LSNAFAIARHLGMSEKILERANQYRENSDRQILKLMEGLERSQQEIHAQQQEIKEIKERALEYEKKAQAFLENIKTGKDRILKEFEQNARQLLKESEQELMKIIDAKKKKIYIRPGQEKEDLLQVKKKLYEQFPKTAQNKEPIGHLSAGQVVRVSSLKKNGIVASVNEAEQKAEIMIGTMKVKAAFSDLEQAQERTEKEPAVPARKHTAVQKPSEQPVSKVTVVGMRVDEALPVVDKAIDQALLHGADKLEIIHGVGTGRLMKAIREHLKDHGCVSSFVSGDATAGGAGITVVEVKG
jgi:DNA mismatch repair protein MutS2